VIFPSSLQNVQGGHSHTSYNGSYSTLVNLPLIPLHLMDPQLHEVHLMGFSPTPLLQTPHGHFPDLTTSPAPTRHLITLIFPIFTLLLHAGFSLIDPFYQQILSFCH
jgi:hypothetical protein